MLRYRETQRKKNTISFDSQEKQNEDCFHLIHFKFIFSIISSQHISEFFKEIDVNMVSYIKKSRNEVFMFLCTFSEIKMYEKMLRSNFFFT